MLVILREVFAEGIAKHRIFCIYIEQYVRKMVEEGRDCSEVLIQLAAVQSALQSTGKVILQDHLKHCIVEAAQEGDTEAIDELCKAIDRYMK